MEGEPTNHRLAENVPVSDGFAATDETIIGVGIEKYYY